MIKLYTIFDHPRDYPASVVVRPTLIDGGKATPSDIEVYIYPDLDSARTDLLARGLTHFLDRHPKDDPVIVEIWIERFETWSKRISEVKP